jgi:hypothetical protein
MKLARIVFAITSLIVLTGCAASSNHPNAPDISTQQSVQAANQAKLEAATRY